MSHSAFAPGPLTTHRRKANSYSVILDPGFAVLDETDSGLDIDALRVVGEGINTIMRSANKGVLLITHYQRLLEVVRTDKVSVLAAGRIVQTGGPELALRLEDEGYDAVMAA